MSVPKHANAARQGCVARRAMRTTRGTRGRTPARSLRPTSRPRMRRQSAPVPLPAAAAAVAAGVAEDAKAQADAKAREVGNDPAAANARAGARAPRNEAAMTATPRAASPTASWRCSATAPPSCEWTRRSPPTRTSTSPRPRCVAASWSRATASPVRCARQGAPSATPRWSESTQSTAPPLTRSPTAHATRTCPWHGLRSASSSAPTTRHSRRSSG